MKKNMLLLENNILRYINYLFLFYFSMTLIFSRSFVGIYILGFRLGELLIAISVLLFIILAIFDFPNFNLQLFSHNFKLVYIFIFLYFIVLSIYSNSNFVTPYTYKASSYIWTLSFIFFGSFAKKINLNEIQILVLEVAFLSLFFISIYGLPGNLIDFFIENSDKYELHKGSDLGLFFIVTNKLINKSNNYNYLSLVIFVINIGIFSPLILYRSRGAFIGIIIFLIYEVFIFINKKKVFYFKNISLFILFLLTVTYSTLLSQTKDFPEEVSSATISESYSSLSAYRMQYYQDDYPFLYFENGRIYSGDGNLNWRLWMWQDQIDYLNQNEQLLKGSGFKDKLYVFTINNTGYGNDRTGLDNINENLHNYYIQILSRGGIVHLILFLSFYYRLLRTHFIKLRKYDLLFYCLSLIWISLFDSSMENAHFPLIFYYFIGNIYFKEK